MSPWWKGHHRTGVKVCRSCHGEEDVHDGLCRHCRRGLLAEETPRPTVIAEKSEHVPPAPTVEPAHDRPWVHRQGG